MLEHAYRALRSGLKHTIQTCCKLIIFTAFSSACWYSGHKWEHSIGLARLTYNTIPGVCAYLLFVRRPVVQRAAPQLTRSGEGVRRHAAHLHIASCWK